MHLGPSSEMVHSEVDKKTEAGVLSKFGLMLRDENQLTSLALKVVSDLP